MKYWSVLGLCAVLLVGCQKEPAETSRDLSSAPGATRPSPPIPTPISPIIPATDGADTTRVETDEDATALAAEPSAKAMVQELLRIDQTANSSLDIVTWKNAVDRYMFGSPADLAEIDYDNVSPVDGLSLSTSNYGSTEADGEWPTLMLLYKGNDVVALIGEDVGLTQKAVTKDYPWVIHYTPAAKQLSEQDKLRFEQWFNTWINAAG